MEFEELPKCNHQLVYGSQEPQIGFRNVWLHHGCELGRSELASGWLLLPR